MAAYDYIIVGAGSAGCVLANRLSADPACQVLLLEAGGSDLHPFIRMPSAFSLPMNMPRFNWFYHADPSATLQGRALHCPRGKVLGGSSSINGMVWVRGHPGDFDHWHSLGAEGWRYADVLPYFKKSETVTWDDADPTYRGTEGPLTVSRGARANPLYDLLVTAAAQAGFATSDDLNGYQQEGFGPFDMSVQQGVRCSTARAYLQPIRQRRNLTIRTQVQVTRVTFDGHTATGVEFRQGRTRHVASSTTRVILSAGAIGSPQLLQLSGVGPAELLRRHNIPVVHDATEVGANLQDHLEVYCQQATTSPYSLNRQLGLLSKGWIGARWLLQQSGLGATNHFESGGFIRSGYDAGRPDIQYHFLPAAISYDGRAPAEGNGFQLHTGPMQSRSRGSVTIISANAEDHPRIDFNYMAEEHDWQVFRQAIRTARQLFSQSALADVADAEIQPGAQCQTDQQLDAFIASQAESAYHPCGTCRMGSDEQAVVDPTGQVKGVDGLMVVDASIFPQITNGNLNAPTIMVAEKIAAGLTGETLPPESPPVYQPKQHSAGQNQPEQQTTSAPGE